MALVELVLVFLDDRRAGARGALPIDLLQRIARPVAGQADEFLGVADRGGERHAALLEAPAGGERKRRQPVALRQRDHRALRCDSRDAAGEAERIGARERRAGKLDAAAAPRLERELERGARPRGEGPERLLARRLGRAPLDQPAPAEIALVAVEPVAALFPGLARRAPPLITPPAKSPPPGSTPTPPLSAGAG